MDTIARSDKSSAAMIKIRQMEFDVSPHLYIWLINMATFTLLYLDN